MISAEDSIKKILNDITSHKKKQPVEYQINGWLQTYKKKMSGKKVLLRKHEKRTSNLLYSLQDITNVVWPPQKEKKQQAEKLRKKNIRTKIKKRQLFHPPQPKKCNENNQKKQSQENKENLFRENKKNTLDSNGDLKRINLQVSDCQSIKARSRCNSQGYVLNEMRRKLKQKSQLKNYMNNWSYCPQNEGGIKLGTQQQFQFLQKRIRMVVVNSSRSMRPKY